MNVSISIYQPLDLSIYLCLCVFMYISVYLSIDPYIFHFATEWTNTGNVKVCTKSNLSRKHVFQ